MDERHQLHQTTMRFESELARVLGGNFANMPRPLEQLLDAIDCEPLLSAHLAACQDLLPQGFDAVAEAERVSADPAGTFGPLAEDDSIAAAQAYLIMRELVVRRTKFHDEIFSGYGGGTQSLQERFAAFMDEVVMRLVGNARAHLAERAAELGVTVDETTPRDIAQEQEPIPSPTGVRAAAPTSDQLKDMILDLRKAAADLPEEDREDALLQLDALQDELFCEHPKERVVRVLLRTLRALGGSARFDSALGQLAEVLGA